MAFQLKAIVFVVVSAGLAWLTRSSLRGFRFHGFYRFFAWEAILILILLNIGYWFEAPFSGHQIASWIALTICTFLVIHGALLLRGLGKPGSARDDPSLVSIEKTTELVTAGAYRYIRHPIYGSLLFLAWGVFLKHPCWAGVALALVATFFLTTTAKTEEAENVRYWGDAYRSYVKRTKMFIPFIY